MFMAAVVPALLVLYVRRSVPESPAWERQRATTVLTRRVTLGQSLRTDWELYLYAVVLMSAAATFSHGTQDLYPVFLREQHHLTVHQISTLAVIFNIGAILGCLCGGTLSQLVGRRRALGLGIALAGVLLAVWADG